MVVVWAALGFVLGLTSVVEPYVVSILGLMAGTAEGGILTFIPLPVYAFGASLMLARPALRAGFAVGLAMAVGLWLVALEMSLLLDIVFSAPPLLAWLAGSMLRTRQTAAEGARALR
jgi:hypothetical protein